MQAYMLAGLKAWKGLEVRSVEIRSQGFQNGLPELQNGASGPPKWSPGPPKLLQVGPKSTRMVVWRLLGTPREPSRPLGSGLGSSRAAKMGAKRPQDVPKASKMVPKWCQNGAKMK